MPRLNLGNFVCNSHKRRRFPLMDGSTTAWAVLFTDGTLKRRGFHKFSSITPAESEPSLCTYFRSQIAISESRSVYCTLHLRPLCTSGFVTLYHPVCRVRRFAVEQSSFRNGSAIRTLKFTSPLWRALYITAFPTFLLRTTAWKWVLIFTETINLAT